jgi:ribosomal protein L11 methyltransferase
MASWAELRLVVARPAIEIVQDLLMEAGALGVQEDLLPGEVPRYRQPWDEGPPPPPTERALLRAWWPSEGFAARFRELEGALAGRAGVGAPAWEQVDDQDWGETWKRSFHRIRISDRLAVAPPWEAEPGDLLIEPGLAFGTGEHPTTRACLEAIDRLARPGASCLDVGCGSGVLALAAAKLGMRAWGVDTDPDAVRSALDAARDNGLEARFDQTPLQAVPGRYALVVANLYAEVVVALAADLARRTAETLVLAGILADREHKVQEALRGMRPLRRRQDGDWVSLEFAP